MMEISSEIYQLTFVFLPKWNKMALKPTLDLLPSLSLLFSMSDDDFKQFCKVHLSSAYYFERRLVLENAKREMLLMQKYSICMVSVWQAEYPHLLRECVDAPLLFFYKGDLSILSLPSLAIVGTRRASRRGIEYINTLIEMLSHYSTQFVVVSGLALGIDAAAHKSALTYQVPTVGVLGQSLNYIYPAVHTSLAKNILNQGGLLLSEFSIQSRTFPNNFIQRNRIIAGIAQTTLIVESAIKGGAMSTARIAFSYNRDVLAIPGRPDDCNSQGCNLLIKNQTAQLVESATDIAPYLNLSIQSESLQPELPFPSDTPEQQLVLVHLKDEIKSFRELLFLTTLSPSILQSTLLELELAGRIRTLSGDRYEES